MRQAITMKPPPRWVRKVYERRGMKPPTLSGPYDRAAAWPYAWRLAHQRHAQANGYYWLPCPTCGRYFGGHEITDSVLDEHQPDDGWERSHAVCPVCSAELNGGEP